MLVTPLTHNFLSTKKITIAIFSSFRCRVFLQNVHPCNFFCTTCEVFLHQTEEGNSWQTFFSWQTFRYSQTMFINACLPAVLRCCKNAQTTVMLKSAFIRRETKSSEIVIERMAHTMNFPQLRFFVASVQFFRGFWPVINGYLSSMP